MYMFKNELDIKMNKTIASQVIGITREHLTNVVNSKVACSKLVAYCITKYLNQDAEIEDYFVRKEE